MQEITPHHGHSDDALGPDHMNGRIPAVRQSTTGGPRAARQEPMLAKLNRQKPAPPQVSRGLLFLIPLVFLVAADPAWMGKSIPEWDEEDAKQVLTASPWVKYARPAQIPELTEAQRREGGQMGGGKGVGLQGVGGGGVFAPAQNPGAGKAKPAPGYPAALMVRWESAFPVRVAELKAKEIGAPDWDGEFYVIAVYDVPGLKGGNTELNILKKAAMLKREGKKDLKPERVDVMQRANGLSVVVFLFPRSDEITRDDKRIRFTAQIARLYLERDFDTREMEFQGKLHV